LAVSPWTGISQTRFNAGDSPFKSDLLAGGEYNLVIAAQSDGLVSASTGEEIDGNQDGIKGDAYSSSFIKPALTNVISVGDTARGPGQVLGLNGIAESNGINGLPVLISTDRSINHLKGEIRYDYNIFSDVSLLLGRDLPSDWDFTTEVGPTGTIIYEASGITAVTGTNKELCRFSAIVSNNAQYASTTLIKATAEAPEAQDLAFEQDPSLVVIAYPGDTNGDRKLRTSDAVYVQRTMVRLDSGFDAYDTVSPMLIAETTGDGRLNSLDASFIQQKVVRMPITTFPDIPNLLA